METKHLLNDETSVFLSEIFSRNVEKDDKLNKLIMKAIKVKGKTVTDFFEISEGFIEKALDFSNHHNNEGLEVYFGVSVQGELDNATKQNCIFSSILYLDIDYGEVGHNKEPIFNSKEEALTQINSIKFKPSIIVHTGHGYQVYWLLNEPFLFQNENYLEFESIISKLQIVTGGDSTHNVNRLFRLPGTINNKCEPFVECKILTADYNLKYSFEEIKSWVESDPIFNAEINQIRDVSLKRNILGYGINDYSSRSEADQSIITKLLLNWFNNEDIINIFENFPTSGKYRERLKTDYKGADAYLQHSIKKATDYLENARVKSIEQVGSEKAKKNISKDIFPLAGLNSPSEHSDGKSITLANENEKNASCKSVGMYDKYVAIYEEDKFGYWSFICNKLEHRLTNFLIICDRQITVTIDNTSQTLFDGKVLLADSTELSFYDFPASLLANTQKLKEYLLNLCGVKVSFYGTGSAICEAIKTANINVEEIVSREFGYNKINTIYVTPDYIIASNDIEEKSTPILYRENWQANKLGFEIEPKKPLTEIVDEMITKFFSWDDPTIILSGVAFAMLPIVYPFISDYVSGKPFLMLQGTTGCGKTTMSMWLQHFFGHHKKLTSWTSTATSINLTGHSYKDALVAIDDFKLANFYNESEVRRAMLTLQNYSDGHARSRANVDLKVRDNRPFQGLMLISAEDIVITEPSTIARGIIIPLHNKQPKYQLKNEIDELSKSFSHFTLKFIQYILSIKDEENFKQVILGIKDDINTFIRTNSIEGDNIPRLTNNFAILKTAWKYVFDFLKTVNRDETLDYYNEIMNSGLNKLFSDNFNRVRTLNPEQKYENALWEMISNEVLIIENDDKKALYDSATEERKIAYFKVKPDKRIVIALKFNESVKRVNAYLREQGGIGISAGTLKAKLLQLGKIKQTMSGTVGFGKKQFRGVYWIGEIPLEIIDLSDYAGVSAEITQQEIIN